MRTGGQACGRTITAGSFIYTATGTFLLNDRFTLSGGI
jgi:hypothetical protein